MLHREKLSLLTYLINFKPYTIHFVCPATSPHNNSFHMFCDLLVFDYVWRQCQIEEIPFPRHLHIFEDNACSENKGIARMRFFAFLVGCGIFNSVQLNYFCVGHTHWKCDQCFACLAVAIRALLNGLTNIDHFLQVCFFLFSIIFNN